MKSFRNELKIVFCEEKKVLSISNSFRNEFISLWGITQCPGLIVLVVLWIVCYRFAGMKVVLIHWGGLPPLTVALPLPCDPTNSTMWYARIHTMMGTSIFSENLGLMLSALSHHSPCLRGFRGPGHSKIFKMFVMMLYMSNVLLSTVLLRRLTR